MRRWCSRSRFGDPIGLGVEFRLCKHNKTWVDNIKEECDLVGIQVGKLHKTPRRITGIL